MSLTSLINRTCTIIRRNPSGSTNEFGDETSTEQAIPTVCEIQQMSREEMGGQGELSDTLWRAFFLPGTVLSTDDALVVDGIGQFEFIGAPEQLRNPRTRIDEQVEATLRRTKGAEAGS